MWYDSIICHWQEGPTIMNWEDLLKEAAKVPMSATDKAEQRLSFAYGNTHIENANITRKMIAEEARKIDGSERPGK